MWGILACCLFVFSWKNWHTLQMQPIKFMHWIWRVWISRRYVLVYNVLWIQCTVRCLIIISCTNLQALALLANAVVLELER
jgi:hypothetical protein